MSECRPQAQGDLFAASCAVCRGTGRILFAVELPRGYVSSIDGGQTYTRPGRHVFQTCYECHGSGLKGRRARITAVQWTQRKVAVRADGRVELGRETDLKGPLQS